MIQHIQITLPLVLLVAATVGQVNQAKAWDGDGWNHWADWNGCCFNGIGIGDKEIGGQGPNDISPADNPYQSGWNHGVADAQYDHQNNLVYNNDGGLCCHSLAYLSGFHKGYDHTWNNYSQQTVNNYVIINGNGNEVYLNDRQSSNQEQNQGWSPNSEPGPCWEKMVTHKWQGER